MKERKLTVAVALGLLNASTGASAQSEDETIRYILDACDHGPWPVETTDQRVDVDKHSITVKYYAQNFGGKVITKYTIPLDANVISVLPSSNWSDNEVEFKCLSGAACIEEWNLRSGKADTRGSSSEFIVCHRPLRAKKAFEHLMSLREANDPFAD